MAYIENRPLPWYSGDVYSCDHFVEPNHLLGNINHKSLLTLVNLPQQRRFGRDKHDTLPRYCRECDVRFACHGGFTKDRFLDTPDGEPGLNYLCAGFQAFFRHIDWSMRHMSAQLRKGRAPADIMAVYSREDAKRARNDACTCGGGRKWKRPARLAAYEARSSGKPRGSETNLYGRTLVPTRRE